MPRWRRRSRCGGFTPDVALVLFALVANRAVDSMSKPATAEWADRDVAVAAITSMYEDQAYRAMELLVAGDARAEVQEAAFLAVADLLNLPLWFSFEYRMANARTIAQRAS